MALCAKYMYRFTNLHRQYGRLRLSELFSSGTKNPKQTFGKAEYMQYIATFLDDLISEHLLQLICNG